MSDSDWQVMHLLRVLSETTSQSITEIMQPHKDVLNEMIPPKKHLLRYQPANAQIGLMVCRLFLVLRNFSSPDHGSNLQHIKHQAKTNLIKSVVTAEPTKLLRRRSNCKLGNAKSKCSRHILTTCISVVLNNFMKKRLTTKCREASCDLFRRSASSPYNKTGTHLVLIRWITTSSKAQLCQKYYWPHGRTHA